MISADDVNHQELVRQRWLTLPEQMDRKVELISRGMDRSAEERLLNRARAAGGKSKRVFWLRQAANVATQSLAEHAACRSGCSHCCNIAVGLSKTEAQQIADEIGRPLNKGAGRVVGSAEWQSRAEVDMKFYGVPCTFLVDGKCSIYEFRPLACRLQLNMDFDDLLCKLVGDEAVEVPYADFSVHHVVAASSLDAVHDDIRNWFA